MTIFLAHFLHAVEGLELAFASKLMSNATLLSNSANTMPSVVKQLLPVNSLPFGYRDKGIACSRLSVSGIRVEKGRAVKRAVQGGKRPGGETGSPLLVQCVMRRRTGTSAPSALPVRLMATKNFLPTNRKSTFLSLFLCHQWCSFKSLFYVIDPKCNTFKSVVMMLK